MSFLYEEVFNPIYCWKCVYIWFVVYPKAWCYRMIRIILLAKMQCSIIHVSIWNGYRCYGLILLCGGEYTTTKIVIETTKFQLRFVDYVCCFGLVFLAKNQLKTVVPVCWFGHYLCSRRQWWGMPPHWLRRPHDFWRGTLCNNYHLVFSWSHWLVFFLLNLFPSS